MNKTQFYHGNAGWALAGAGHDFSILQQSNRSCSSPACCQQFGSHPRIWGWSCESHSAAGAAAGTAMSSRSCVTAQAPAHPVPSQKPPLPGSSPQHMVNTLLIIMAVNSTSLLPEPPAGTGTRPLPARLALVGTNTPGAALLPCPLPGVSLPFGAAQPRHLGGTFPLHTSASTGETQPGITSNHEKS